MAGFTAFYDAKVLYPAGFATCSCTLSGLFRAKWSADVHEIRSLAKIEVCKRTILNLRPPKAIHQSLKSSFIFLAQSAI